MQVPCATLHDVVNYLVEKTEGVLIPLIIEEPYEKNICTQILFHSIYLSLFLPLSFSCVIIIPNTKHKHLPNAYITI